MAQEIEFKLLNPSDHTPHSTVPFKGLSNAALDMADIDMDGAERGSPHDSVGEIIIYRTYYNKYLQYHIIID